MKNQHLLAGLAALGVVNLLAVWALVLGERASARGLSRVEGELSAAREEHRRDAESLRGEAEELRQQLQEARSGLARLRDVVEEAQSSLARTRKALEAVEERLNKQAAPGTEGREGAR